MEVESFDADVFEAEVDFGAIQSGSAGWAHGHSHNVRPATVC